MSCSYEFVKFIFYYYIEYYCYLFRVFKLFTAIRESDFLFTITVQDQNCK